MNKLFDWIDEDPMYISYPENKQFEWVLVAIWSVGFPILFFGFFTEYFELFMAGICFCLLAIVLSMKLFRKSLFDNTIMLLIGMGFVMFFLTLFVWIDFGV